MRRAILAVTLGGLLLTGAACDGNADSTTAADSSASSPVATAGTAPAPDYTANTREVCGRLQNVFDRDLAAFHIQIGRMIAHKEAKATTEATTFEKAAAKQLQTVAANLRKQASKAQEPALRAAAVASAAELAKSGDDSRFFDSIKSQSDFDRLIGVRMGAWLTPVTEVCARVIPLGPGVDSAASTPPSAPSSTATSP